MSDTPVTSSGVRCRSPTRPFRMDMERMWFEICAAGYSFASITAASFKPFKRRHVAPNLNKRCRVSHCDRVPYPHGDNRSLLALEEAFGAVYVMCSPTVVTKIQGSLVLNMGRRWEYSDITRTGSGVVNVCQGNQAIAFHAERRWLVFHFFGGS
jgi:hypothetical protein